MAWRVMFLSGTLFLTLIAVPLRADEPHASGLIDGTFNAALYVSSIEKSVPIYTALGFLDYQLPARPRAPGAPRPAPPRDAVGELTGFYGSTIKFHRMRLPGMSLWMELIEIGNAKRIALEPRAFDVRSITLVVLVRDIAFSVSALQDAGARRVTVGSDTVSISTDLGPAQAVLLQDPDGIAIELRQLINVPASLSSIRGNVLGGGFCVSVFSLEQTLARGSERLGLRFSDLPAFAPDNSFRSLLNVSGGEFRRVAATPAGEPLLLEFMDARGIDRRTLDLQINATGFVAFGLTTPDIERLLAQLRSSPGFAIMTPGKGYLPRGDKGGVLFFRDPEGLILEACEGC